MPRLGLRYDPNLTTGSSRASPPRKHAPDRRPLYRVIVLPESQSSPRGVSRALRAGAAGRELSSCTSDSFDVRGGPARRRAPNLRGSSRRSAHRVGRYPKREDRERKFSARRRLEKFWRTRVSGARRWPTEGLQFSRRSDRGGHHYFILNRGDKPLTDGPSGGRTPARSAAIFDSMRGEAGWPPPHVGPGRQGSLPTARAWGIVHPEDLRHGRRAPSYSYLKTAGEPAARRHLVGSLRRGRAGLPPARGPPSWVPGPVLKVMRTRNFPARDLHHLFRPPRDGAGSGG